jgi:diguanylate cyclase (GGDEF)-like protein
MRAVPAFRLCLIPARAGNMNLRTSFRSKLLLLTIVPLAVAQVVTLFAVMQTVQDDVYRRAQDALVIGGTVIDEFLAARSEQLTASAQVLAADFGLRQAAATRDVATLKSILVNHSQRVSADIAIFLDLDVNVVASSDDIANSNAKFTRLIADADDSGSVQSTLNVNDATYHTIARPLHAPVQVGWIVLGFLIDQPVVDRIGSLTDLDVSIISTDGGMPHAIATTYGDDEVASSAASMAVPDGIFNSVYLIDDAGVNRLTLSAPFVESGNEVLIVLQRSMQEAMLPYNEAKHGLAVFSAILLLIVTLTAGYVSGTIAKPLRDLANATRRMISGSYDSAVDVSSDDEFGELATSFNSMRNAISDREERISHHALHDSLTGLPNRDRILQSLGGVIDNARDEDASVAILSIRLTRMAAISSTLGHNASDELTKLAARHLEVNVDDDDILGQVGTNEFVLILTGSDTDNALLYADKIEGILGAGVTLGRINITLQTAIGISVFPTHGEQAADLLRNASIARSEAETRHERVRIYEAGREEHYVRQLRIVNDLRSALQREEIQLHFQPKILLPNGKPCGAEALVRWRHPELGYLAPDEFIGAAEQAGTILHLSRYVLKRALQYCREWRDQKYELGISVNLSARDLQDEYLPHFVLQILEEQDIEPHDLTLEITENSVMQDVNLAITVLGCLRDIGVRISIDDFGTGHSSLAQLRNIPLHELKIDKSFVSDMLEENQNEAIVRATIELAHNMKLEVCAEGVEDEDTLRYLSDAGCEQAQGYFLSKPVPSDYLIDWLQKYEPVSYSERRKEMRPFAAKS